MNVSRFVASLFFVCWWFNTALSVTIPMVAVGNPGNPADTRYLDWFHPNGFGSVAYEFNIGKTEHCREATRQFFAADNGEARALPDMMRGVQNSPAPARPA